MLDFNDAKDQQYGELIPNGTLCKLMLGIRPGGAGEEGWLRASKTEGSDAEYIDAEFTVVDGTYENRKLWQNLVVSGGKRDENGNSIAAEITRSTLKAILNSSRGIDPADMSERAVAARRVGSYGEFDNMVFVAKVGIEKGKDGYADKNKIATVITPDKKEYRSVMDGTYQAPKAGATSSATPWDKPSPASKEGTGNASPPPWASGTAPPKQQTTTGTPTTPSWAQ